MSDFSVSVTLPSGVHDCPHICDVVRSTGRWCLEEEQQRMRRDSEEIEEAALLQVCNDLVLKRNRKLHHSFVRDVKSRGMMSATLSAGSRWYVFVQKSNGRLPLTLDARRSNAHFLPLLVCDCCLPQGSDESKSPSLKVWMWILRRWLRCGPNFSSVLPRQTCVTVSTGFECHCPQVGVCCLRAVLLHVFSMTGEMLEG